MFFQRRVKRASERSEVLRQALSRLDRYRQEIGEFPKAGAGWRGLECHRRCRAVRGNAARESIALSEEEIAKEQRELRNL